ncbi:MAG: hypothetical protein AAFY98_06410 [Verrucomicrobiota bacterium]
MKHSRSSAWDRSDGVNEAYFSQGTSKTGILHANFNGYRPPKFLRKAKQGSRVIAEEEAQL